VNTDCYAPMSRVSKTETWRNQLWLADFTLCGTVDVAAGAGSGASLSIAMLSISTFTPDRQESRGSVIGTLLDQLQHFSLGSFLASVTRGPEVSHSRADVRIKSRAGACQRIAGMACWG